MSIDSEPTLTQGILLSDLSIVEQGTQKRSIIGCFDQLNFRQFPVKIGRFFITAWVTNVQGSVNELDFTIRIQEKSSAHVVFSSSSKINFHEQQNFERDKVLAISTPVVGMAISNPGIYSVVLILNGDEIGSRDFQVRLVARPAEPPQQ